MMVMDGISTPLLFGWWMFLVFEGFTLLIEGLVMLALINFDKPITPLRAGIMLFVMNIASAFFALPMWKYVLD